MNIVDGFLGIVFITSVVSFEFNDDAGFSECTCFMLYYDFGYGFTMTQA